jgi:hypothetical protein
MPASRRGRRVDLRFPARQLVHFLTRTPGGSVEGIEDEIQRALAYCCALMPSQDLGRLDFWQIEASRWSIRVYTINNALRGIYRPEHDTTYDANGHTIGRGNLPATLLTPN